jgi:pimeloyl-ACP methyl ester carboxylesterase
VPEVSEHSAVIQTALGEDGELPLFWRSAPSEPGRATPLYLHGVPSSSLEWTSPGEYHGTRSRWRHWWRGRRPEDDYVVAPRYSQGFLERSGGLAPDLPGFGRSGKPGFLQYTIEEYDDFIERFLDLVGVEKVSLIVHDWGAVGLAFAQRRPERVERLVIINAVPLLPGYRWHRTARIWRTPGLGELAMGTTNSFTTELLTRESNVTPGPMPPQWRRDVLDHFDPGTQRAILRLYRSSPPERLAAIGAGLASLEVPALVAWGMRDPYIPARFGAEYASTLPRAQLEEFPDAGHWAWLDRPDLIERVTDFLREG